MLFRSRKNAASHELADLVAKWDPDVLCLQEAHTEFLPSEIGPLTLAETTKTNRLGLAVYYRGERFEKPESKSFALKKAMHDILFSPTHERLLATKVFDKEAGREIILASFHAAPLTARNSLRRTQIKTAHEALKAIGDIPAVMVGDYNYPLFTGRLVKHVAKSGYDLTLSDRRTYLRYKIFRGHFDFVTSTGVTIEKVETLPQGVSDHLPIMVTGHVERLGE